MLLYWWLSIYLKKEVYNLKIFDGYVESCGKLINIKGRASRKEFWAFILINLLISSLLAFLIIRSLSLTTRQFDFVILPFALVNFLLFFSVLARRFHDTNRSADKLIMAIISLFGIFYIVACCCVNSDYGENDYGKNPKGEGNKSYLVK